MWNVAKLTSQSSSSYSCLLAGAELGRFMPPIAADALLTSDSERPAASRASTTLLRRFRVSFVCDMTLPSMLQQCPQQCLQQCFSAERWSDVMLGSHSRQVSKKTEKAVRTSRGIAITQMECRY